MVALDSLPATGLVAPGSLITYLYRVRFPANGNVTAWIGELKARFPSAGWRIREASDAAPGVERLVRRTSLFMTLVGLSTLLMGGLGIAIALTDHLARKGRTIATLKCLGAPARLIFAIYGIEIALLAGLGIFGGLGLGVAAPILGGTAFGQALNLPIVPGLYGRPLIVAGAFGFFIAA